MIGKAIYSALIASPAAQAITGGRVYPVEAQEGVTAPYITYSKISSVQGLKYDGPINLITSRVQIDIWAARYADAQALAAICTSLFNGTSFTAGGVTVQLSRLESESDERDSDTKEYRRMMDFFFTHEG